MIKIGEYSHGFITFEVSSVKDVLIIPPYTVKQWVRKQGHLVTMDDIKELLDNDPDTIIIGTGSRGLMLVESEVADFCLYRKPMINILVDTTKRALEIFREKMMEGKKVVGGFHLKC